MHFTGFSPKALTFFRQLKKNNTREWFAARKSVYEDHVRAPMLELVALVNDDLRKFAVDYVLADPKKAVYRIYRDTRFSKDKTPYKTHIGALFPRAGLPKHAAANYYFGVSDEGVEVAAGMYMPGPGELATFRKTVVEDTSNFRKLIRSKALLKSVGEPKGDLLSRVPKGFSPDHPAADLLRFKNFYFYTVLPAKIALGPSIRKEVITRFRLMAPVVEYINDALLRVAKEAEGEEPIPRRPAPMF